MLERWTRAVLRVRALVLAVWLVLALVGLALAPHLSPLLANSLDVPGSESDRAQRLLADRFGERPDGTFTIVMATETPSAEETRRTLERALARAAAVVEGASAREVRRGVGVVYGDVVTPLSLDDAKRTTVAVRTAVRAGGATAQPILITGAPALQHDIDPVVARDLRLAELVALPIALAVLILALGFSLAIVIPFAFAAATIGTTLGLLYGIAHVTRMTSYVENLVVLIGLALAIDYALLCVDRFRAELAAGVGPDEAVLRTMATTGRAVAFSAAAVAVGLGALLLVPLPLIRSMGVGGILIPLVSLAALATLQPVLLSLLGQRALSRGALRHGEGSSLWRRYGEWIVRRRAPAVLAAVAVVALLAAPLLGAHVTPGSIESIPGSSESVRGAQLLSDGVGAGAVTPIQAVIATETPGGAASGAGRAAIARLTDLVVADPEAYVVANGKRAPYVTRDGSVGRVIVGARHGYGDPRTRALVERMRDQAIPAAGLPAGARTAVGGAPAQATDFVERLYAWFPILVALILGGSFLVLLRAFRSVWLPLQAVLLDVVSVAAGLGVTVAVVQHGLGAGLLGIAPTGAVEAWVPVVAFALLFGLSMDYEVFLVMPMREAVDQGAGTDAAIVDALSRTGPIVTAAAGIMVAVFSGFALGAIPGLQQLGLTLAVGVLVDATLVRMVLLPGGISLLGAAAWRPHRAPARVG